MPARALELPEPNLSLGVRSLLSLINWSMQRAVAIDAMVAALEAQHYVVFPSVQAFLRSFGELDIRYIEVEKTPSHQRVIHYRILFDPSDSETLKDTAYFSDIEIALGRRLCLIGTAEPPHLYLLMDAEGQVYGATETSCGLLGKTALQALDVLIQHTPMRMLYQAAG